MKLIERVAKIQVELKAPKGQFNGFGKYKYRSCEDILEAVKPHLGGIILTICDDMVMLGDRFYIKATATLSDGTDSVSNTAFAREPLDKKGMDASQITGMASSYARKYALNGLFLIDDTNDADNQEAPQDEALDPKIVEQFNTCENMGQLKTIWAKLTPDQHKAYTKVKDNNKKRLGG